MGINAEQERLEMIGNNITNLRKHKYLTQQELADKAGLSRVFIGQVEKGIVNPTIGNLFKICDALNCYLDIEFSFPKE